VGVPDAVVVVPELVVSGLVVSELRRFMVGLLGSSLVDEGGVLDAVVELGLPVDVVSVAGFDPKCGRLGSGETAMTGIVFEGFKAVVVFRGAARGLTLP
jgi:hypothetical protein